MRVLVMQQKMVGDVLTSSILCENLRRFVPGAEVHFVVHSGAAPVLQGNPHIDRIHTYPARGRWRAKLPVADVLRSLQFDVLIDVYGKWESLQLVRHCRAKRSISYRKWYSRSFYTDTVPRVVSSSFGLPLAIEHRLQLLQPLLGPLDPATLVHRPRLYVSAAERDAARGFLATHGISASRPLLMVSALGSDSSKTYPLPGMAQLLDRIVARSDAQLLFNCLPNQRAEVEALFALCGEKTRLRVALDAYPQGLREFVAVLAECDGLFGNEGGAVNMARALDVPSFCIFSPWISKAVWDINHDGLHTAVHVADFVPQRLAGLGSSDLKRRNAELYAEFHPHWIEPALDTFVATRIVAPMKIRR
ncbi:MAG: glycosyltransferase family 9 protein [Pseudomarimonas sp.]